MILVANSLKSALKTLPSGNQNDIFMGFLAMSCNGHVAMDDWNGQFFLVVCLGCQSSRSLFSLTSHDYSCTTKLVLHLQIFNETSIKSGPPLV